MKKWWKLRDGASQYVDNILNFAINKYNNKFLKKNKIKETSNRLFSEDIPEL